MSTDDILQRQQAVLREIIQYYLARHEPVSARTLAKMTRLALSPTTIRNLMEDLSNEGFLTSEGVSRGRIPTQKAFTVYVTRLRPRPARKGPLPQFHADTVDERTGLETVLAQVGRFLAQHTGLVALAVLPDWDRYPLDWVRLSSVPPQGVLVAIQTTHGDLLSKVLELAEPFPEEVLHALENHICRTYHGEPLGRVRNDIMTGERMAALEPLASPGMGFRLLRKAFEWESGPRLSAWGQQNLLGIKEFQVPERLESCYRALEDPNLLETVLAGGRSVGEGRVSIGTDTNYTGLEEISVVAFPFGVGADWQGQLGVLGPMRMDYSLAYQLTAQCAAELNSALHAGAGR